MAFNFKTSAEIFLQTIPQTYGDPIYKNSATDFQNIVDKYDGLFSYGCSDEVKERLSNAGLPLSPFMYKIHSHPACKMLENYFLYVCAKDEILKRSYLAISAKKEKIFNLCKKSEVRVDVLNRLVTAKDSIRYGDAEQMNVESLTKRIRNSKRKHVFFFDELHYWSMSDLDHFLSESEVETVLATIVFPVESMKYDHSLNPELYTFHKDGDTLHFFPDGCKSEGYSQPSKCDLLRARYIRNERKGTCFTVTILKNIGAHFLVLIKKGSFVEPKHRFIDDPSCIMFSKYFPPAFGRDCRIRVDILKKMVIYLLALKKSDEHSAVAKLRSLSAKKIFLDEMVLALHLGKIFSQINVGDAVGRESIFNAVWNFVRDHFLLDDVFEWSDRKKSECLLHFFSDIDNQATYIDCLDFYNGLSEKDAIGITKKVFEYLIETPAREVEQRGRVPYSSHIFGKCRLTNLVDDLRPKPEEVKEHKSCINREFFSTVSFEELRFYNYRDISLIDRTFCRNAPRLCWYADDCDFMDTSDDHEEVVQFKENETKKTESSFTEVVEDCSENLEIVEVPKDGKCMYSSLEILLNMDSEEIIKRIGENFKCFCRGGCKKPTGPRFSEDCDLPNVALTFSISICVHYNEVNGKCTTINPGKSKIHILLKDSHFSPLTEIFESEDEEMQCSNKIEVDFDRISKVIEEGSSRNSCLINGLAAGMNVKNRVLLALLIGADSSWADWFLKDTGADRGDIAKAVSDLDIAVIVHEHNESLVEMNMQSSFKPFDIYLKDGHISIERPRDFMETGIIGFKNFTVDKLKSFSKLPGASRSIYKASKNRATKLRESFKDNYTGVVLNGFKGTLPEPNGDSERDIVIISGFAGSGKSRGVLELVKSSFNKKSTMIISPRKFLAEDWEKKMSFRGKDSLVCIRTFEVALKCLAGKELIVIDELTLFPNGYLDLVMTCSDSQIVVLCDPMQARYHMRHDILRLDPEHDVDRLEIKNYLYFSHRLSRELDFLDVQTKSEVKKWENHGRMFFEPAALFNSLRNEDFCILSPSESRANEMKKYGSSMTLGQSQGLTFNKCVLVIDSDCFITGAEHWIVGITRAREGFAFLCLGFKDIGLFVSGHEHTIMGKVLLKKKVSEKHLICSAGKSLANANLVKEVETLGSLEREERLDGDPWLKGQLFLLETDNLEDVEPVEPIRHDSPGKTHLPIAPVDSTLIEISEGKAREYREFISNRDMSKQFRDDKERVTKRQSLCDAFETIYPKHEASDDLTLFAAIQKRIVKSNPLSEARKLQRNMHLGKAIFKEMDKVLRFDTNVMVDQDAVNEDFVKKRLNKSAKLIAAHSERSDPDWKLDHFFLFMKSQLCTKFEKRFVDAKAGQTLACFSHAILTRFGVPFRVFEKKFSANLPKTWYIHTMKNFDALNEWVVDNVKEDVGTESDYEAFDRSQDSIILALELEILKKFGWEQELIEDYKTIKLWMGCRLGAIAIMRFTGEFGTFFFNTIANIAFTIMRYNINRNNVLAFAGDDMFADGKLKIRRDCEWILEKISLKAKVQITNRPMFCGWYIKPFGIVKEPKLVLERFLIAEEKGNLKDCLINYAIELSYGYRLGEQLWEVLDNPESQQEIVRKIVKHKHLLPKKVRHFYQSTSDVEFAEENGEISTSMGLHSMHDESCGLNCNLSERA